MLTLATVALGSRGKTFKWMEEANPYLVDLVETDTRAARVIEYIERYRQELAAK